MIDLILLVLDTLLICVLRLIVFSAYFGQNFTGITVLRVIFW